MSTSEASPKKNTETGSPSKNPSTPKVETPADSPQAVPTTPVQPDSSSQENAVNQAAPKPQRRSRSKSLPRGKYILVGIDIATTGRRLIDEIVQLSAYTPTSEFSQYIMPYMNLNPAARQRHQLRVITVGFFRMMKSMQTYKAIKTKSEIAALQDFLDWLETLRKADPDSQGIILIYHDKRKFLPYMLLEAFKKYELLGRFLSSVRSFANGYDFATAKCANTVKYLNLRELSNVLLNNNAETSSKDTNTFEGNASVRARLSYEITKHLAKGEQTDLSAEKEMINMSTVLYEFSHPVSQEIAELRNQRLILEMQNSLRPIFIQYFKTTLYHRVKAVTYRRILAERGFDYDALQKLWDEKKRDGFVSLIEKMEDLSAEEKTEMTELLDSHFDPEKTPMQPPVSSRRRRRKSNNGRQRRTPRRSRNNSQNTSSKSGGGGGGRRRKSTTDGVSSPDSGTAEVTVITTPETVINEDSAKVEATIPAEIAAN